MAVAASLTGFWYPALLSLDVRPGAMKAQTLLDMPLVICRDKRGKLAALQDICPHRAMPLSFGCFDGERLKCSYHGWQFDMTGTCRHIPALVEGSSVNPETIGVTTFPCRDQDGYVWVYVAGSQGIPETIPDVPRLPVLSQSYRMLHVSTTLKSTIDNGIVGLMDPAHGAFVHQSAWWRSRDSIHEKAKTFEPIPNGFRMKAHAPSRNSGPYKLLGLSDSITTTIDFILPNLRLELVQAGRWWISMRTTVTPISQEECRMDFCAAWNFLRWLPFSKSLFRMFARVFLNQDSRVMERQSIGLKHASPMMLLDDADMPAKWYFKLKVAHLAARQHGGPLEHPLKGPVTLRWRS
jgi:phenylpropionate dioxygenase-like ring-hydroxylating dioxygenase large terminal subunit